MIEPPRAAVRAELRHRSVEHDLKSEGGAHLGTARVVAGVPSTLRRVSRGRGQRARSSFSADVASGTMESHSRTELRRLPNVLSGSRVLLAVLFIPAGRGARIALILLAAATDFFDGWLARRTNTTTRWGALIDPFADRLFVLVAIVMYVLRGELSVVESLLMLSRDIATALGFFVARAVPRLRAVEFKARFPGKVVTVLQLVTLFVLVVGVQPLTPFIVLVALASALAIADYTHAVWRSSAG